MCACSWVCGCVVEGGWDDLAVPVHITHIHPHTLPTAHLQVYRDLSGKASWAHVQVVWRELHPTFTAAGAAASAAATTTEAEPADGKESLPFPPPPSYYDGGVYLVEGVFTRRPREARGEAMTAAQLKQKVCGGLGVGDWCGWGCGIWCWVWSVGCRLIEGLMIEFVLFFGLGRGGRRSGTGGGSSGGWRRGSGRRRSC